MLRSEFIERTGFDPTAEEYAEIEERYYDYDGDKDAFCKEFKKSYLNEMLKKRKLKIEKLEAAIAEQEKLFRSEAEKSAKKIKKLQSELDKELEWKPCAAGTNMAQDEYESLKNIGKTLTDKEAKDIIYQEFGFAPDKVQIIRVISIFEANKYRMIRIKETFDRTPVYNVSDYNYIRFDCAGRFYEMINGALERYYC